MFSAVEESEPPELADIEPHHQDPSKSRPAIFNCLAHQGKSQNTKKFLNQLLIHVALNMKNVNGSPHAPATVATGLRTLFADFGRQGLSWKMDDFQKWEGAVIDAINSTWEECLRHDCSFGVKG